MSSFTFIRNLGGIRCEHFLGEFINWMIVLFSGISLVSLWNFSVSYTLANLACQVCLHIVTDEKEDLVADVVNKVTAKALGISGEDFVDTMSDAVVDYFSGSSLDIYGGGPI
jgi:hypothetical protein